MEPNRKANSALLGESFEFSVVADGPPDDVRALQTEVYGERYGSVPDDGRDSRAAFLVARDRAGSPVGSLRVLTVDHRPFSFDSVVDLSSIGILGTTPAEIGRWCVHSDYRSVAKARGLHFGMMKFAYLYALARSISDYLICVYPDLERFYRGLFFEDVGLHFEHPDWGAVAMFALSLPRLEQRLRSRENSLAEFLLAEPGPNFILGH